MFDSEFNLLYGLCEGQVESWDNFKILSSADRTNLWKSPETVLLAPAGYIVTPEGSTISRWLSAGKVSPELWKFRGI